MLRDYQITLSQQGLDILKRHGLVYMAMEVRCGKTLTAIAMANNYGSKAVLFLTKKKAIASIQRDFEAIQPSLRADFDLYVTNYEAIAALMLMNFDLIILDEAHCLGQYPIMAQRTKDVKKLCEGKPIIYLSGSPSPESYSQLFHQLFVSSFSPFNAKNFYAWAKEYVHVKKKYFYGREANDYSNADKDAIMEATRHLFISYTQEQAGFTQMVEEHVIKVKMKPATYALASKLRARRVFTGSNGKVVVADTEVKLMGKLHQIYSGSVITEDGPNDPICFDDTKARFIKQHFEGRKIGIFYKFRAELEMLRWVFGGAITESPEEFNERQDLVFCSQIQSGREGVNLSTADAIVMFNIDFSHLSYIQARARMQTRDREKACSLYWVFAENGIEEKIYERVIQKQDYQIAYFRKDFKVSENKAAA